jgi:hypothetical protein
MIAPRHRTGRRCLTDRFCKSGKTPNRLHEAVSTTGNVGDIANTIFTNDCLRSEKLFDCRHCGCCNLANEILASGEIGFASEEVIHQRCPILLPHNTERAALAWPAPARIWRCDKGPRGSAYRGDRLIIDPGRLGLAPEARHTRAHLHWRLVIRIEH